MAGSQNNVETVTATGDIKQGGHCVLKSVHCTKVGTGTNWIFKDNGSGGETIFEIAFDSLNDIININRRFENGLHITVPGGTPECVILYE